MLNEKSLLQGTVLYLLRKRHSNMKRTNTEDVQAKTKSKKGKRPAELEPSPDDIQKTPQANYVGAAKGTSEP